MGHHILIFGASGVSGWAVASQALRFPSAQTFSRVTALTNRPLSVPDSGLPSDPRLQLVSGIDLTRPVDSITSALSSQVASIETVTHVVFAAYIETPDYPSLVEINTRLVRNAVTAIDRLAGASLKNVILQTGGKHYGVEFKDHVPSYRPPLRADAPRIAKPWADNIFCYNQCDALAGLSEGKGWRWYEVRPDVIVGFTPGGNYMNVAQGLGFYLSLYRAVHGEGATMPFVGTGKSWTARHTDTFQDVLAQEEIHVLLNEGNIEGGSSFNAADGEVTTWEGKWPVLTAYFGLRGAGPGEEAVDMAKFATEHARTWKELEGKHGLKPGIFERFRWKFVQDVCAGCDFDRQYDLGATRDIGFNETVETTKGYTTSFDRMRKWRILPSDF